MSGGPSPFVQLGGFQIDQLENNPELCTESDASFSESMGEPDNSDHDPTCAPESEVNSFKNIYRSPSYLLTVSDLS